MSAIFYLVSWNQWSIDTAPALRFLLAALVLVAVTVAVPVVVAALTPMIAGCCAAIAGNAGAWAMVPVVFGGAWAVKP